MKKLLTSLLALNCFACFAQELYPIRWNSVLEAHYPYISTQRIQADTLDLPFFDDFSAPGVYPSPDRWLENKVYVNNDMGVNPVSLGVATFDGMNEKGAPYSTNIDKQGAADTLTSKPLRMNFPASDSIYLSFFYQPQGISSIQRAPDSNDSLVLQFKKVTTGQWVSVWKVNGTTFKPFKQVSIAITDPVYLGDGFQFRFINYGGLSGFTDIWNLDYVELGKNRSYNEPLNDVALTGNPSATLTEYRAMPYNQYEANDRLTNHFIPIRNNFTEQKNVDFNFTVKYKESGLTQDAAAGGLNVQALSDSSIVFYHNNPLPVQNKPFILQTRYSINVSGDPIKTNDTLIYEQNFGNYFAYDDGTAENAFGVTPGTGSSGKVAVLFNLNKPDTLTSVKIFFNRVYENVANELFTLTIWKELNPETIIYQKTTQKPSYTNTINGFWNYMLDSGIILDGSFYLGWTQSSEKNLQVGFDANTDHKDRIFYKKSADPWGTFFTPGSLMIRPVFADAGSTGIVANFNNGFKLYPNPATEELFISGIETVVQADILNSIGQLVRSVESPGKTILIGDLSEGIYVLRLHDRRGHILSSRFIKQ